MTAAEWAVRLEVRRSLLPADGQYEYTLRTWIRRCQADPCTADSAIFGTYFQDTRTQYAWFPAPNSFMQQDIKLEPADHEKLDRILFGFTGAAGGTGAQSVLIKNFQLSFIRPNDPIVTDDHVKYPIP